MTNPSTHTKIPAAWQAEGDEDAVAAAVAEANTEAETLNEAYDYEQVGLAESSAPLASDGSVYAT